MVSISKIFIKFDQKDFFSLLSTDDSSVRGYAVTWSWILVVISVLYGFFNVKFIW